MLSNNKLNKLIFPDKLKEFAEKQWENLNGVQQNTLKKSWKMITYKWQWQIAINSVFLLVWLLDTNIPAVHNFDLQVLALLPIPNWVNNL